MASTSWLKRHGACNIEMRTVGEWMILEVSGKFTVGEPEMRFMDAIEQALQSGTSGIVVRLLPA